MSKLFTRRTFLDLFVVGGIAVVVAATLMPGNANATDALWQKLRNGGHTLLIRHAKAPGTGDPANFAIGDCSTQRNLSQRGRLEASRMGARIAASGAVINKVLTSQWCRTRQTAEFGFSRLAPIEDFPPLNSFFSDRSNEKTQTDETLKAILDFKEFGNQVMVTHQVNITALTGLFPREGEAIIVRSDGDELRVVGRLTF